jgi:hypothetical protein
MSAPDDTRINDAAHAAKMALIDTLGVTDGASVAQITDVMMAACGMVLDITRDVGVTVAGFSVMLATLDETNPDTPARRQ